MLDLGALDFEKSQGLVTVVTQDARTCEVLMVAHADREALAKTIATGEMHYRSRSRGLWRKGQTSGNVQKVVSLTADCDGDSVLARVIPAGPACHKGMRSCFESDFVPDVLTALDQLIAKRASQKPADNPHSYTRQLLEDRNLRFKKVGEETAEFLVACADGDKERATEEAADVLYHLMVALRGLGLSLDDVRATLAARNSQAAR
jgi:phosphoribosyl-ATP pyrophosphohydrolase/phosphoribosyl-AMP cyclohydrolase